MTQREQVIKYLENKGVITTLDAMKDLLILDLQSVIRDLKREGYDIRSEWVSHKNIYGQIKSFKKYFLGGTK